MDRLVGNHRDRMEAHDSEVTRLREELARSKQQLMDASLSAKSIELQHARQLADVEEASQAAIAAAIAAAAASAKGATTPTTPGTTGGANARFQIHKPGLPTASPSTPAAASARNGTGSNGGSPSSEATNGKTAVASSEMGPPPPPAVPRANGIIVDRAIETELRTLREALADVQEDVKAAQQENERLNEERERLASIIEDMERKGGSGGSSTNDGASAETKEMADRLSAVLQQLEDREVELAELRGDNDVRIKQLRADFATKRAELQAELLSKRKIASKLAREKDVLAKEKKSLTHQTDQLKMVVASKRAAGDAIQEKKLKRLEHTMQVIHLGMLPFSCITTL
jgi:peptidoglycan hydrolase CwlO-like protein